MKLLIDNFDGFGLRDYTPVLDSVKPTSLLRKLNRPAEMKFVLTLGDGPLLIPVLHARVILVAASGMKLFTGYTVQIPVAEYVGWGDRGSVFRYGVGALSDVMLMDQKAPPPHPSFVNRRAGDAFKQLTEEALPNVFDVTSVELGDTLTYFSVDPAKRWTDLAAEIAVASRCAYRDLDGKLYFAPLGANTYALSEDDTSFSPSGLRVQSVNRVVNDLTILGDLEPAAHVKDFFVGDGHTTKFYLSQKPFARSSQIPIYNRTILDEIYATLDPMHWALTDPLGVISVGQGQLFINGGTGVDGTTLLTFIEEIELGSATLLKHGDVIFNGASSGVIGGLYASSTTLAGCIAGFRVTPSGTNSSIQAIVGGAVAGSPIVTQVGHHYVFSTQLYPAEVYRSQQVFHSSVHGVGNGLGGAAIGCDVRIVLEVQDIDPGNPATQVAPATVLYDGVVANAPQFCNYALINASTIHAEIAFTYITLPVDALVRSTLPGQSTVTVPTGSLLDGAQCRVSSAPSVEFYAEYIPAANQLIEVSYRGQGHAAARVVDLNSISALSNGADDGVRGSIRQIGLPLPRTSSDCENAALALLDDATRGWTGEYETWSSYLPGEAADIFPGDGLAINIPSQGVVFDAIVSAIEMSLGDIAGENSRCTLRFVDVGDPSLDFAFVTALVKQRQTLVPIPSSQVGSAYLDDLTNADFTNVGSTTVTIDAGFTPVVGGEIEVRNSDAGWGVANNRNLIGRFTSSVFSLTRYARSQVYFLKRFDNSVPPKYSRHSAALHVDYPF